MHSIIRVTGATFRHLGRIQLDKKTLVRRLTLWRRIVHQKVEPFRRQMNGACQGILRIGQDGVPTLGLAFHLGEKHARSAILGCVLDVDKMDLLPVKQGEIQPGEWLRFKTSGKVEKGSVQFSPLLAKLVLLVRLWNNSHGVTRQNLSVHARRRRCIRRSLSNGPVRRRQGRCRSLWHGGRRRLWWHRLRLWQLALHRAGQLPDIR